MTAVPRISGSKLLVQIGDAASPETFTHDCLINTQRGIQFNSDTQEHVMPDCDNPEDPAWKDVSKDGLSITVTGAGMLYTSSVETWWDWFNSDDAKNCRIKLNVAGASGGGYWAVPMKLTSMEISADDNKATATCQVTLVSNGAATWTANA